MKNKIIISVISFLILIIGLAFIIINNNKEKNIYLESAILGGNYLINHIDENGKFVYEYDPINKENSNTYNILRHAGTTYSLLELYEYSGDKKFLNVAEKALIYLLKQIKYCNKNLGEDYYCVVEDDYIKLGGNGLAVLAIAKYSKVTNSNKYLEFGQKLANYIVFTQSENGEFTAHKVKYSNGFNENFISGYYPGEAIFGLMKLYGLDKNEKWLNSANYGAKRLINVRDAGKNEDSLYHDHWLLYSLNELYKVKKDPLFSERAKKITNSIIKSQLSGLTGENEDWNGGYYIPPESTPTATRSEGLNASYEIFMSLGEIDFANKILETIKKGLDFELKTQITSDKILKLNADKNSLGGFYESLDNYNIRIDYVQHNISAILGYLRLTN